MFTNEDLILANALKADMDNLSAQIAILNKLNTSWVTNYPDLTVRSKLVFHYQKTSGVGDLELVEIEPGTDTIASLVTCLNTVKAQLQALLDAKTAEFEAIGTEEVP